MLGPAKSRRLDAPIAVSLEDLVPADNFYRHVEAHLRPQAAFRPAGEILRRRAQNDTFLSGYVE